MFLPLGALLSGDPTRAGQQTYQTTVDQGAQQLAGNFLQSLMQPAPVPGAQAMPQGLMGQIGQGIQGLFGGGGQQPPQPGPPPGGAPQAPTMPMSGGGAPQGPPPMARPMQAPPQMPPQGMPQMGGGQNPIGTMSFPQIVAGLVRSNPGARPAEIFSALRQLQPVITPFMNAEALAAYRNAMLADRSLNTNIRQQHEQAYETSIGDRSIQQRVTQIQKAQQDGTIDADIAQAQIARLESQRPTISGGRAVAEPQGAQPSMQPGSTAPIQAKPIPTTREPAPSVARPAPGSAYTPAPPQPYAPTASTAPQPQAPMPGVADRFGGLPQSPDAAQPPAALLGQPRVATAAPEVPAPSQPAAPAGPPPQQIPRPGTLPPGAAPIAQTAQADTNPVQRHATAIQNGTADPTLKDIPMGERRGVVAELDRRNFDLARQKQEWTAADRTIKSLAGPQMTRFFGAINSIPNTIQMVRDSAQKLDMGNFTFKNRLDLIAWAQGQSNTPKGQAAIQYLTATKLLQDELAMVIAGGNSPTNRFLEQATSILNDAYGQKGLNASLDTMSQIIQVRKNALTSIGGGRFGGGAANPYLGTTGKPQQPATEGGGDGMPRPQSLDTRPDGTWKPPQGVKIEKLN